MPATDRPRQLDLTESTALLEHGVYAALTPEAMQRSANESEMHARLAALQISTAMSMHEQALGQVAAARDILGQVAVGLPAVHRRNVRGRYFAVARGTPPVVRVIDTLVGRTVRVIAREQAGLAEYEEMLRPGRHEQKELFVIAYIEHLRRVDCDYHLLCAPAATSREVCFEAAAKALARRATNLCRLADPRAPDVAEAAFRGAGGAAGIRAAAYALIVERAIVPSSGPGAVPAGVPLRDAHVEAFRRAHLYRTAVVR